MSRRPSRPVRVLTSALASATLLTTAACSDDETGSRASEVAASRLAAQPTTASPSPSPTLTEAGARAALITEADLEDDWTRVANADRWDDRLLIGRVDVADFVTAKADAADCQRLLDALYDDDLLGRPAGASALAGFQMGDSRLLHQVAAYDRDQLDDSLAWMNDLPVTCDRFTATDPSGGQRTVEVIETSVPDVGDARQGLHVTVQGTTAGAPATLTLDIAAVRVGADAITVTAGGLAGGEDDSMEQAARQGTQRLQDVLAGKTPSPQPGEFD
ncbi:hypothetical protein [Streptomyces sp. S.PNR 29]|uniref:hypothetical protein n=1 Tax=Streptomyces sp. S.PNR 29 TaxID=2973805 RepID=UPI0025B142E1|nr:hypothetical protein [Streptomyces sp. S.PNR 29]MDN0200133.1 hypothetical protein [Streptomyces sp. S.PNR 29]